MKLPILAMTLLAALFFAVPVRGGELHTEFRMGLSGEYNDNIHETASNQQSDFVTHVKPQATMDYEGGRVQGSLKYRGDYQFHVQGKESDDYRHYLDAFAQAELVENLFFLRVEDSLQPMYRDVSRGDYNEDDTYKDLVNRNKFTVSPYFLLQPSERTSFRLGYRFVDQRYSETTNESSNGFFPAWNEDYDFSAKKSQQHALNADVTHEVTERFTFMTGAEALLWNSENDDTGEDTGFTRYTAYIGGRYEIAEGLKLEARGGPTRTVPNDGNSSLWPNGSMSLIWDVGRSQMGLSYSMDFTDDPETGGTTRRTRYKVWWNKTFDRSRLATSLGYDIYKDDETESGNENSSDLRERDDRTYNPAISYTYDLSERLSAFTRLSANIQASDSDSSDRYYASTGLKYELSEDSTVDIAYIYKYVEESGSSSSDAYDVNRVILNFTMNF